uniref:Uncharacterized protein n=1 Tax=Aegilops tauschii TaxID=37682 RepID=M8CFD3_AEGTA
MEKTTVMVLHRWLASNVMNGRRLHASVSKPGLSLPRHQILPLKGIKVKNIGIRKNRTSLISDPAFVAAHKARTEPQLLIVANSFHGVASGELRDLRLLETDGSVARVIKGLGDLWTITSGPGGPVCATRDGRVLNVIDLATGKVLMTSTEMGDGGAFYTSFGIGSAAPSGKLKVVRRMSNRRWRIGRRCSHPEYIFYDVLTSELPQKRKEKIGSHVGRRRQKMEDWRRMQSPPIADHVGYRQNSVVTIDGVIYFLYTLDGVMCILNGLVPVPQVEEDHVICLDLESEQWKRSIKAPVRLLKHNSETRMVELNGTLCMVHSEGSGTILACTTVWLLSDLAEGTWVEAYVIPMAQTIDLVIPFRVIHHVLEI